MTDLPALLPCPFCAAAPEYVEAADGDGRFIAIQCTACGCGGGKHYPLMDDARPNAAAEWNKRPQPPAPVLDDIDVFRRLTDACATAGSQRAWARAHGISEQKVSHALNRQRDPAPEILAALGLRKVTRYAEVYKSRTPA